MGAIIVAIVLAFVVSLAIWEGIALGAVWLINTLADTSISYGIVGSIVAAFWLLILIVKLLFLYGASKAGGKL